MAGSLLARTMASLRMYLACGLLLYLLLCSSSSMHIRRTDKGLALTSSLLPNFTHKFAIRIEAYLLALSHPSHFRHNYSYHNSISCCIINLENYQQNPTPCQEDQITL